MDEEPILIDKIIPGGQGLGQLRSGKKVLAWGVLPGETITKYKIIKNKSHYLEVKALEIINESSYRVEPKDDIYLSTSPWQIIDYNYELKLKQDLVVELFREHSIDISSPEIITDNQDYYYRNKMEYALYWDNNDNIIKLAFHERGSHRKIPIKTSSIERPEIFTHATKIINDLNSKKEPAYKYQSLLLRCNQKGEISGGLYENNKPHPKFNNLTDKILDQEYSYSPNGFFQINLPVYEIALKEIKSHIKTDNVLDLYAGVGTIGLSVARDKNLTLVEVDKYAFLELTKNITSEWLLGATNIQLPSSDYQNLSKTDTSDMIQNGNILAVHSKSEEVLKYIESSQTVILDPPRAGCDKKLIDRLSEVIPETIIYLSCNPATQARDIKILLEKYQIKDIKTFNFFPHTPHIENLVILEKK